MQKTKAVVLGLAIMCALVLTLAEGQEKQKKDVTDLTGRLDVNREEIIGALARKRGFQPVSPGVAIQPVPPLAITIPFDFNSASIPPAGVPNLTSIGEALTSPALASDRIRIEGHTDSIGSDQYNLRLSKRRAQSIKQYLVQNFKIAAERLLVIGRGEEEPVAENNTEEGRQKNRRVVLVNLSQLQK
jgi:outer membrane protein OmpA-like peptidoglycan-associated protein